MERLGRTAVGRPGTGSERCRHGALDHSFHTDSGYKETVLTVSNMITLKIPIYYKHSVACCLVREQKDLTLLERLPMRIGRIAGSFWRNRLDRR